MWTRPGSPGTGCSSQALEPGPVRALRRRPAQGQLLAPLAAQVPGVVREGRKKGGQACASPYPARAQMAMETGLLSRPWGSVSAAVCGPPVVAVTVKICRLRASSLWAARDRGPPLAPHVEAVR